MSLKIDSSGWKRIAFADAVANVNDYFDPEVDGVLPYVAGPHIAYGDVSVSSFGMTDDDDFPPTFKRKFQPGDVLLHSRGIEKLASVDRVGVTGEKLFVLRSKDENILLQEFLVWLLLAPSTQAHMQDHFTGSVNKFLNWRPLAGMEVDLPPIEEQKRIADLLWAIERHRTAKVKESSAATRASDDLFSTALSVQGEADRTVSELLNGMTVGVVVKPSQYYTDDPDGVPALRGLNILPGRFDLGDLVRFRPESAAALEKSTLREGDVVIVRTGRPGDAAVVSKGIAGFNCIDLIITRPGSELMPEFFARYLNSSYGRYQIARLSAGTAQQHFNVGALKKLRIPTVSISEQRAIMSKVALVDKAVEQVLGETDTLSALRSSVLADVFGGAHGSV